MYCKNCGKEVNEKAVACASCGFDPKTESNFCYECGAETKEKQIVCIKCGVSLKGVKTKQLQNENSLGNPKINYFGIVSAIIMAISIFLPWIKGSSSASFMGHSASYSTGGISGISLAGGILALLITIAGAILLYKQIKWAFLGGILNLLTGISYLTGLLGSSNSISGSGFSGHSSIDPQFGLIIFCISAILFTIACFVKTSNNSGKKINFKEIINSKYFKIGLASVLFLASTQFFNSYSFPVIGLLLIAYPVYFVFKENFRFIFSLLVLMVSLFLADYFLNIIFDSSSNSGLLNEIRNSVNSSTKFIKNIFILFLIISIAYEALKEKENPFIKWISKFKINRIGWILVLSSLIIPLVIYLPINISKLRTVTEDEKKKISVSFSQFEKEWMMVPINFPKRQESPIKFGASEIRTDNYGKVYFTQYAAYEQYSFMGNFTYDVRDYKFHYPLSYDFQGLHYLTIDTMKSDTLFGSFLFKNEYGEITFKFYAIPLEKYQQQKEQQRLSDSTAVRFADEIYATENGSDPLKEKIVSFYKDLNNSSFDANNYFANKIESFISFKNTTPAAINNYIQKSYYTEFQKSTYHIEDGTFSSEQLENKNFKISFIETGTCYRKSKQKEYFTKIQIEVLLNSEMKIINWKQLKVIERK